MKKFSRLRKTFARLLIIVLMFGMASQNGVVFAAEKSAGNGMRTGSSTNLAIFLTNVNIVAPTDGNGNYIINPAVSYEMVLSFSENENAQFADDAEQTYVLPQGIVLSDISATKFVINIVDENGAVAITDNTFKVVNGQLLVRFNQADPNYGRLTALANVSFSVRFSSKYDKTVGQIVFNSAVVKTFVYEEVSELAITKAATYDKATDRANYVLKITSTGNNDNVVIQDKITGTALTLNQDVSIQSSVHGALAVAPDYTSITNGFRVSVPQMTDGEILTVRYSAAVDNEKITGNGTIAQTSNKAAVTSTQISGGREAEANLADKITFQKISKEKTGEPVALDNNRYMIPWKVRINEDHKLTIGGKKIIDFVRGSSQAYMQFTSSGITMEVTKENGTKEVRVLPWAQLVTVSNDKGIISWEYTAPVSDGKASYVITYQTVADATGLALDLVVVNQAKFGDNFAVDASATIKVLGDKLTIEKGVISSTSRETEWQIAVHVVAAGYPDLRVSDDLPRLQQGSTYYFDRVVDGSINVTGLLPGESYKLTKFSTATTETIYLDFYQDAAQITKGLKPTDNGAARDIVITLKTTVNQNWLTLAANSGYTNYQIHRNYAFARMSGNLIGDNVQVIPKKQKFTKEYTGSGSVVIDGVTYPVFRYLLTLENSDWETATISDSFSTEYLKFYGGEPIDIYSGTQADQPHAGGTASAVDTATGINIQVTGLPRDADGRLYPVTKLYYSLIVKDQAALEALNQAAVALPNGYTLDNTATWEGLTSETVSATHTYYPYVDKELSVRPTAANGYVAEFKIIINKYASDLDPTSDELAVQDVLSPNLRFIPDSLTISPSSEVITVLHDSAANTLTITKIPDGARYEITYRARVLGTGSVSYSNEVTLGGYKRTIEETVTIESSGGGAGSNPSITIVKRDQELLSHTLSGAVFQLYYMSGDARVAVKDKNGQDVTFTTGVNGSVLIIGNQQTLGWTLWTGRTYCLVETTAPTGFTLNPNPIYFVLSETPSTREEYLVTGDRINIQNARIKIDIHVIKRWVGPVGGSATVTLMNGTTEVGRQILNSENNWQFTFDALDKYDENGQEIAYTMSEDPVENYWTTIAGDATNGFTVTNTITGETSVSVTKEWAGEATDYIVVRLYANGVEKASAMLSAETGWKFTFEGLDKYADGNEIQYTVTEDAIAGYTKEITGDAKNGFVIKNTKESDPNIPGGSSEKITVSVQKKWVGTPGDKAVVKLLADGTEIRTGTITEKTNWKVLFEDLPKYEQATGREILYSILELPVEGYTAAISGTVQTGFTVTNTITDD